MRNQGRSAASRHGIQGALCCEVGQGKYSTDSPRYWAFVVLRADVVISPPLQHSGSGQTLPVQPAPAHHRVPRLAEEDAEGSDMPCSLGGSRSTHPVEDGVPSGG